MTPLQKIIKICATIFAAFLAITIIGSIVAAIFFGLGISSHKANSNLSVENNEFHYNDDENGIHINVNGNDSEKGEDMSHYETYDFSETYTNVESFDIEASINSVTFVEGNAFTVTMKNVRTDCKVTNNGGVLTIHDTSHSGFSFLSWIGDVLDGKGLQSLKGGKITVTYPSGFVARECNIEAGTGSITMSNLQADTLTMEAGTGSIKANGITARFLDLECGTGSVTLEKASFAGTDIETGTGSVSINGKMTGQNTIECGVGSVSLHLEDPQDSYALNIEKGLGSVTVNGTSYSSMNSSTQNATNSLSIEGGVGSVNIDFAKPF
ncbi:MAG: hypothetical protein PWP24_56 [Clostridiales bacterium]|nr:hypothetical protein [Clostridiales bacterium]